MIIELLLDRVYNFISIFLSNVIIGQLGREVLRNIPPESVDFLEQAFSYIAAGAGIVANYIPFEYCIGLFTVILALDAGVSIYFFVLWVLKKIPALGIE